MDREHFSKHYDDELRIIKEKLVEMGEKVELMLSDAIESLVERNSALAQHTIAFDNQINALEVEIDERCLEVLACRQPAARDLRFITLALKIVTDLERMGDQCANIAKRARELSAEPPLGVETELSKLANAASTMVRESLDAFVRADEELALKVCREDRLVDDLNGQIQRELLAMMPARPSLISSGMRMNYVSKCLERIADHATNVAEMVIFMIKGKDIRHTMS